jgi:hypothetical protein
MAFIRRLIAGVWFGIFRLSFLLFVFLVVFLVP